MWPSMYIRYDRNPWDSSTNTDYANPSEFVGGFKKERRNPQATEVNKMFDEIIFDISGKKEIQNKGYLSLIENQNFKAISVRQPWADLIVRGIKDVENRKWTTPHRGPLLIHSPQTFNNDDFIHLKNDPKSARYMYESAGDYVMGCIIGIVTLTKIVSLMKSANSDWAEPGFYHFLLSHALMFKEPIIWKGQLGVFDVEDEWGQVSSQIEKTLVG